MGRNSGVPESDLNIFYQPPRESHPHGALHELLSENSPHLYGGKFADLTCGKHGQIIGLVSMIVEASGKHHFRWLQKNNQQRDNPASVCGGVGERDGYEQVSWAAEGGEPSFIMLWGIKNIVANFSGAQRRPFRGHCSG